MSYNRNGWRVRVDHHHNFAADLLNIWVGQRNDLGEVRMVQAIHMDKSIDPNDITIVLSDPVPPGVAVETPPTFTVSHELASALFDALTPVMLGTDSANVLGLVANLRRERDDANRRFDEMLKALSNMNACATAPGGVHPLPKDARQS